MLYAWPLDLLYTHTLLLRGHLQVAMSGLQEAEKTPKLAAKTLPPFLLVSAVAGVTADALL